MIRYTSYAPRLIPVFGTGDWAQIDRVQSVDKTGTINKLEIDEVGRDGAVDYLDQPPSVAYKLVQNEYGTMSFFNKLANKADSNTTIVLGDFQTSTFDICAYLTDNDGTFKGTVWIPKQRLSGFSINIGSPNSIVQRNFDFVGEDWITWQGTNKYLIFKKVTVESGDTDTAGDLDIVVSDPVAVADPDAPTTTILRVVRVRSGVSTELVAGTDYSYATGTLTVSDCATDDVIKYWYTAASYIGGSSPFTNNDSDLAGIYADSVSIYLETGNYVYRLQSVNIDVKLTRDDKGEIGNSEIVQRGVSKYATTVTLGRFLESHTIEEILRGESADYGKLDIRKFTDQLTLRVYFYSSKDKTTYKIGLKLDNLAPSELKGGTSVGNMVEAGDTLVGQSCTISSVKATIDA